MPRSYTHIHDQLLTEFLMENFPPGNYIIYPRVGSIKEEYTEGLVESEKRAMSPWKLRPDAIAWKNNTIYIIELLGRANEWFKYAKLIEYENAIKKDPMYKQFLDFKFEKWLISPEENEFAKRQCEALGVKFIKFLPKWAIPYYGSLPKRKVRPYGEILE
jgi:hypothetical protein